MLLKVVITGRLLLWIGEKRDKSETAWKVRIIIKRAWHLYRNVLHLKVLIISSSKLSVFLFSVQFSHSVKSDSLWPPWTAACQASLSITNSQSFPKPISIESGMPSNHLILCWPFSSHLQSYPASESFPMSQFFKSGGQSIGVSASTSVLPKNIQDWSPLGWTGRISLQSKGLSRVFFSTTVQKHQFFGAQLSSQSNSHIHTWLLENP